MARARTVCLLLLVLSLVPISLQAHAAACERPRCRDIRVPLPKGVKVPESRVRVLLPDGYDRGRARYPVVYLLHGVADTYKSWTSNTDIVAFTKRMKVIIVMPDGGHGSEAGWYSDWEDGSRQWETFHTKVLVRYIDRTFRTMGDYHRGVIGASMGGFGAMSYASRNELLYRAAASFSGAVDTMFAFPASGPAFHLAGEGAAGQSVGTPNERVWGDQRTDEANWREHNPTDRAGGLRRTRLFISTGNGFIGGPASEDPSRPHAYGTEAFIYRMNMNFKDALDAARVQYRLSVHNGYHDWPHWQLDLHRVLPDVVREIAAR